jgi:hypothetical protein
MLSETHSLSKFVEGAEPEGQMKRFLMLVGVAAVAGAMYVAAAPGSQQASGPTAKQFNALKKQVASLSKTLKTVKAEAAAADGFVQACLVSTNSGVLPINLFGDPNGAVTGTAQGYKYGTGADPTLTTNDGYATALNLDTSTPFQGVYIQGVDPTCVTAGATHHLTRSGHLSLQAEHTH